MRWSVQPYRPESWGWIPGGAQQSPPRSSNNHWPKCPQRGWKTKLRLFCMTLGSLGSPEQNTPFLEEPGGLWKLASSELQCRLLWLFDQSSVTWGYFQCRLTPVVHIELHEKGSQMNWFTVLCSVLLFVTLWTEACQAPPSMEFSRPKCLSGLLFPTPGDLPDPGMEPTSLASLAWQVDSLPLCHIS